MQFLKRHKELLWFGLFAVVSAAYFSLQFLGLRHHLIHTPVDDVIPFVPAFIIPYVLWYFYVPGMMLFMCFKDREVFMRQVATLFTGAFICIAVFALYPTRIYFRPDASGDGLLLTLCRLVYANDQPYNVLPSLHCYEALVLHLATFRAPPLREYADRDEEHIDVAKLQRQLAEPVEPVEPRRLQKLHIPGQKAFIDEKSDDVHCTQRDKYSGTAALRPAAQQSPQQHDRSGGKRKEQQIGSIKRSYDHGETSSWKSETFVS